MAAQYRRPAARRGAKRAAVAVAHRIRVFADHLVCDGGVCQERLATVTNPLGRERLARRAVRRIQILGYLVTLTARAS